MKAYPVLIFLLINFYAFGIKLQASPGLNLQFRVLQENLPTRNYSLVVYRNGDLADSFFVRRSTDFILHLDLNCNYILRINKPGYLERLVALETTVPENKSKEYDYDFDVEMLPDSVGGNTLEDLPVLLVEYNSHNGKFTYSSTYGSSVGHLPETRVFHRKERAKKKPGETNV